MIGLFLTYATAPQLWQLAIDRSADAYLATAARSLLAFLQREARRAYQAVESAVGAARANARPWLVLCANRSTASPKVPAGSTGRRCREPSNFCSTSLRVVVRFTRHRCSLYARGRALACTAAPGIIACLRVAPLRHRFRQPGGEARDLGLRRAAVDALSALARSRRSSQLWRRLPALHRLEHATGERTAYGWSTRPARARQRR